jgi:hypothetical protein
LQRAAVRLLDDRTSHRACFRPHNTNRLQALYSSVFESLNIQTRLITGAVGSFMSAAALLNVVKAVTFPGLSFVRDGKVLHCQVSRATVDRLLHPIAPELPRPDR